MEGMRDIRWAIGQSLVAGFDGPVIPSVFRSLVKKQLVGNVILFRRNIENQEQLWDLCAELHRLIRAETGLTPLIMIGEEGGSVSRLGHITGLTPCPMAVGASGNPQYALSMGKEIGRRMRSFGINLNMAPVLDCFSNPDNLVIGNRAFGTTPEAVSAYAIPFLQGLMTEGIIPCGKHFPGHGNTAVDSHLDLPVIDKTLDELRMEELVPFQNAIWAGIPALMSAHIGLPMVNGDATPATASRFMMTELLRNQMGFQGLLLSDGMEMNGIRGRYGIKEGTCLALMAGVDLALICHDPQEVASVAEDLVQAVNQGKLDLEELDNHLKRIVRVKERLNPFSGEDLPSNLETDNILAERIMQKAIRILNAPEGKLFPKVGKNTLFLGISAAPVSMANDDVPLDGAEKLRIRFQGKPEEDASDVNVESAVAVLSPGRDLPEIIARIQSLLARGIPVVAASMYTPSCLRELPDSVWKIAAWQYDELSIQALGDFIEMKA